MIASKSAPPLGGDLEFFGELTDDALIVTDAAGLVTGWNLAAERLYGLPRQAVVGHSILATYPVELVQDEHRLRQRLDREHFVRNLESEVLRTDGTRVPVHISARLLSADAGTFGTVRLVTLRGDAERRARWRLAAIVESSDDAIVSKDLNGIVQSWNRAAEHLFGYTAAEMIGQSIRRIIPAERQAEEDFVLANIRSGQRVDHFDTERVRKDGTLVPVSLTVSPVRDDEGRIVGASKIARDISDRRRIESERARLLRAATETAELTERLNEVGHAAASTLDREKVVQAVTDAATELTGARFGAFFYNLVSEEGESYTLYTLSGVDRSAFEGFPMPRNTAVFGPTFRGEGVVRSGDITKDPRYGHNGPYFGMPAGHLPVRSYLAVPVRSAGGEVLGGLFFGHEQVDRFTLHHERLAIGIASWASITLQNAALYVDLQNANRLKDQFLATLSHELRTPLNAVLGYAQMLESGAVAQDRQPHAVKAIRRNATALSQIVDDLLDISRIISGKMRLQFRDIDLLAVIQDAVATVSGTAAARGVSLSVHGTHVPVSGDPERLGQVFWNLLTNAVKFTSRGGRVDVRVETRQAEAIVTVTDTGIGISPAFLPHVFERFRQAQGGSTREHGGLGLGLNITRHLVELHGGTIRVSSEGEGLGTSFSVALPVRTVNDA